MNYKRIIRRIIKAKEAETVKDALIRHKTNLSKYFYHQKYDTQSLKSIFVDCGIEKGDIVLVHASWRNMYNYLGTPDDVIQLLFDLVGETGTVLMPCYGIDRLVFDVDNTVSSAGVLSETFRKTQGVIRSKCTHFSVAGKGAEAEDLLSDHFYSEYGFDTFSPCYKLALRDNAKILFLGLGRVPTKISIFHCAGAILKEIDPKLKKLLSYKYTSTLIDNGQEYSKQMYIRQPGHGNKAQNFRLIFNQLSSKKQRKISNLDVVAINAKEALEKAVENAKHGVYCYKKMSSL